jgi:zinc-ribbon domain
VFCNYCGSPNPDDSSFCSACGKAIGAHPNPPPARAEIPPPVSAAQSLHPQPQAQAPVVLPAQQPPQMQPVAPAAAKTKVGVWILVGFAACLVLVIAVAWGFRQNQAAPEQTPGVIPDSAPVQDNSAAQTPAPVADAAPAQAPPPPAAPQNPIVGQWKTTTLIGDTILTFTGEGRYTIKSALVSDAGVYVFSAGDGTLRLQPDAVFSHDIVIWQCQLSGDSLSVVDPDGAGHVYTRIQE